MKNVFWRTPFGRDPGDVTAGHALKPSQKGRELGRMQDTDVLPALGALTEPQPPPPPLTAQEVIARAQTGHIDRDDIRTAIKRLQTEHHLSAEDADATRREANAAAMRFARAGAQRAQEARIEAEDRAIEDAREARRERKRLAEETAAENKRRTGAGMTRDGRWEAALAAALAVCDGNSGKWPHRADTADGRWVTQQRRLHATGKLSESRVDRLYETGFGFELPPRDHDDVVRLQECGGSRICSHERRRSNCKVGAPPVAAAAVAGVFAVCEH